MTAAPFTIRTVCTRRNCSITFQNPRNPGEVPDADATAEIENPACGDVLRLSLKIESGRIAEIRFKAKGCVPSMACASALTELVDRADYWWNLERSSATR